jgi:hypothetical protein
LIETVCFRVESREIAIAHNANDIECNESGPRTNQMIVTKSGISQIADLADRRRNGGRKLVAAYIKLDHLAQACQRRRHCATQLLAAQVGVPQLREQTDFRRNGATDADTHNIESIQVTQYSDFSREKRLHQVESVDVQLLDVAAAAGQSRPIHTDQQDRTWIANCKFWTMELTGAAKTGIYRHEGAVLLWHQWHLVMRPWL